jgi:ABC-type branched-subunit amino acid transport system ATPase component
MLTRLEARRYRCLENIGVGLPQYAVLVGANGSGKSTLLDIPRLIGDCLKATDITQAFNQKQLDRPARCSALRDLVFCNEGKDFVLVLESVLPGDIVRQITESLELKRYDEGYYLKNLRYELRLEIFNEKQIQVKNEYLFLFSDKTTPSREEGAILHGERRPHKDWRFVIKREYGGEAFFRTETQKGARNRPAKFDAARLALPKLQFESRSAFPAAIWFLELMTQGFLFYQPDLSKLQAASPPGLPSQLLSSAENLPHLAMALREEKKRFDLWQEHVKTALPNIERIELKEREEDNHVYFRLVYQGGYEVTSSGLSDGTLRILALSILPYLKNLPSVVFLEEPENGIHPRAIETILQSLTSVYNSQLLTSSHSPVVLANSRLDQIICASLDERGSMSLIPGRSHPLLKEWKGQIDLGTLFATGVLE